MWIFAAQTSQKANAATVQKNKCFGAHFLKRRKPPKKWQKHRFSVQEILNTFSWSVALFDIFQKVADIAIKQFAKRFKVIPCNALSHS